MCVAAANGILKFRRTRVGWLATVRGQRVRRRVSGEDRGGFVEGYRAKRIVEGKERRWGCSKGLHNVYSEEAAASASAEAMKSQPKWRTRIEFGHFTILVGWART